MLDVETRDTSDLGLLDLSSIALSAVDYETWMDEVDGIPVVRAESELMVVLIGSAATVDGLLVSEPILSSAMVGLLGDRNIPDRRRDGYVVLLTSQRAEARQGEALFGVTYNLRHVRRIVRVGVDPTTAGVARALRPILPLSTNSSGTGGIDPIEELAGRLMEDGFDRDVVRATVRRFRNSLASGYSAETDDVVSG